jgi:hypothetical protein
VTLASLGVLCDENGKKLSPKDTKAHAAGPINAEVRDHKNPVNSSNTSMLRTDYPTALIATTMASY